MYKCTLSLSFRLSPTVLVDYVDTPINQGSSLIPIESHCACRLRRHAINRNLSLIPIESHCACRLRRHAYQPGNFSVRYSRRNILRRPAYSSASKLFIPFLRPETRAHCEEPYLLMFVLILHLILITMEEVLRESESLSDFLCLRLCSAVLFYLLHPIIISSLFPTLYYIYLLTLLPRHLPGLHSTRAKAIKISDDRRIIQKRYKKPLKLFKNMTWQIPYALAWPACILSLALPLPFQ